MYTKEHHPIQKLNCKRKIRAPASWSWKVAEEGHPKSAAGNACAAPSFGGKQMPGNNIINNNYWGAASCQKGLHLWSKQNTSVHLIIIISPVCWQTVPTHKARQNSLQIWFTLQRESLQAVGQYPWYKGWDHGCAHAAQVHLNSSSCPTTAQSCALNSLQIASDLAVPSAWDWAGNQIPAPHRQKRIFCLSQVIQILLWQVWKYHVQ